jgi:pentafunctional AROM polypeptide
VSALLDKMKMDKKNAAGAVRCTVVTGIGASHDCPQPVALHHFERLLAEALTVVPPPYGSLQLRIRVPGSKSISNRVLLMAALGEGPCRLRGLLHSDDTHVMLSSLQLISEVAFTWEEGGDVLRVDGCGGRLRPSTDKPLYLGNAGTASRFLTTTCALIDAPGAPATTLTGDPRMKERPIGDLTDALRKIGCDIEHVEAAGSLPLRVRARGLAGGKITLSGKVSSQFVSSVLLSAPYAREAVELHVPEAVSQQYIEMTLQLMAQFGVVVAREGNTVYRVPKACYVNPGACDVEADASSATYPLAIAAITGGTVTAEAIGSGSCQGDAAFHTLCALAGCTVSQSATETTVTGPPKGTRLKPFDLDMESMTDAFMTAAALAAVADGTSTITGIANQRVKGVRACARACAARACVRVRARARARV